VALVKATISLVTTAGAPAMDVMFNPGEYSITRNMTYAEIGVPGLAMPLLQFIRGDAQVLALELFVDSSDRKQPSPAQALTAGAVDLVHNTGAGILPVATAQWATLAASPHCEHRLQALRLLAQIDNHLHAPPVIRFAWGGDRFEGVVTSFVEKFTMFDENGQIQRARVTLQVKSYQSAGTQYTRIDPQSPDRTKTVVVRAGERLDMIAAREYGDPSHWPVLAAANQLARPRVLVPGTLLTIPPLE
jgi:nucleoid-associated protein YgaU